MFFKIEKLTKITYKAIKKCNPLIYENHVPKPTFMNKKLQLTHGNLDENKDWACKINCVKSTWYFEKKMILSLDMFVENSKHKYCYFCLNTNSIVWNIHLVVCMI